MRSPAAVLQRTGARIKAARVIAGLTQAEVAQRIGLTRASIANLEAGRQDIGLSRLAALVGVLDLDVSDVVAPGGITDPPHSVTIRTVREVTCQTCATVLGTRSSDREADRLRRSHIAQPI